MDRRKFLSVIGVVSLAGCTSGNNSQSTLIESPTPTPVPTASPIYSPTETESPTPTETPTETETSTETPEPTPSEADKAAEHLEEADKFVKQAIGQYQHMVVATQTPITKIRINRDTPAAEDIKWSVINSRRALEDAKPLANDEQQKRIKQLRQVRLFLRYASRCQYHLVYARGETGTVRQGIWKNSRLKYHGGLDRLNEHLDEAASNYSEIRDIDPQAATASEFLSVEDISGKKIQLKETQQTLKSLKPIFASLKDGVDKLAAGFDGDDPVDDFYSAAAAFDTASFDIEGVDSPSPLEGIVDQLACAARALQQGSERMEKHARAERDGDDEKANIARERAKQAFESCEVVWDNVAPIQDFK